MPSRSARFHGGQQVAGGGLQGAYLPRSMRSRAAALGGQRAAVHPQAGSAE